MKVLILGLSSIAQRRVIPALAAIDAVDGIDIASVSKPPPDVWPKRGAHYTAYDQAIARSAAEAVYISLPNSMHEAWIMSALDAGKHVIVDKPATLTLESARHCLDKARQRNRLLAEATVFNYHPHVAAMQALIASHGPLTHIDAQFIIPPLPATNFRTSRELGGGCLLDMGSYAAAVARLFGSGEVALTAFAPLPAHPDGIDVGFSLLAQFDNGARYSGHFSFESEYQNRLLLVARSGSLLVERVFSPPPDLEMTWQVRRNNAAQEQKHPSADAFRCFLEAAFAAIYSGAHEPFAADLIADASFRHKLAASLRSA